MDAVKLECALEAAAGDQLDAIFVRSWEIDQADRQTGQKDKRLSAVGEAEIPRSPIFERIAGNVIDQDRDQHGAAPKVDVADAVGVHLKRPGAKTAPLLDRFQADGEDRFADRCVSAVAFLCGGIVGGSAGSHSHS